MQAFTLLELDWKPSTWDDIGRLPHTVVNDLFAMRAGQSAASTPFDWFRTGTVGVATLAHLFRVGPDGPELLARCGDEMVPDAAYRRDRTPPLCQRCEAIAGGRPLSIGTIGDLDSELKGR